MMSLEDWRRFQAFIARGQGRVRHWERLEYELEGGTEDDRQRFTLAFKRELAARLSEWSITVTREPGSAEIVVELEGVTPVSQVGYPLAGDVLAALRSTLPATLRPRLGQGSSKNEPIWED